MDPFLESLIGRGVMRDAEPQQWVDNDGAAHRVLHGKLSRTSPEKTSLRRFVMARDGHRCCWCGIRGNIVVDHIISLRNGGSNHPDNLQSLCSSCNSRKVQVFDVAMEGYFAKWQCQLSGSEEVG